MTLKKKTLLGLFFGLGGLGWVAGIAMTLHAGNLERDNRVISSALTSSIIERASLVRQLEQLSAQQQDTTARMSSLRNRLATSE